MLNKVRLKNTLALAQSVVSDPRWADVVAKNAAAEGTFVYGVRTTGVYCRPSCPSKLARPENVKFYATGALAEAAGFRACKRCQPTLPALVQQRTEDVAKLCRLIETSDRVPTLSQLAEHIGLSTFHTHRLFKTNTGVTPRSYAAAHRAHRMRQKLESKDRVTEAIYSSGHGSSGQFYATSNRRLGMTPTKFKTGGAGTQIHFAVGQTSLGAVLVAATDLGLCAIFLGDDPAALVSDLERRFPRAALVGGDAAFEQTVAQVVGVVENPQLANTLPLDIQGTAFQQRVWQALTRIPRGTTATYLQIAKAIGLPKAFRAVAQACGANPLAVAIPCHRVVRTNGDLAGYRWGIERKRTLLEREENQIPRKLSHRRP